MTYWLSSFFIIACGLLFALKVLRSQKSPKNSRWKKIPTIHGNVFLGCVDFFARRDDFLREGFRVVQNPVFRFRIFFASNSLSLLNLL